MFKKYLKIYAVPLFYILAIIVFGTSMLLIQKIINTNQFESQEPMEYVDKEIINDNEYIPVVANVPTILRPYQNNEVKINKSFYHYEEDSTSQENALIFYENTYMQNSGVSYTHKETFDVTSILDGTVIEVTENTILGKTIKIRHGNDLISTYSSLSETNIKVDDTILRGQVIGKSGTCSLYSNDSNLHFELNYQGKNIDPEKSYDKTIDEL